MFYIILIIYTFILLCLFIYGSNCFLLIYMYTKRKIVKEEKITNLPNVTIQLPVYNEMYVVERLIQSVTEIDYPKDRFEIQVLDDSTDETTLIIQRNIQELRIKGFNIYTLHRKNRNGFKAGALKNGLKYSNGEFIAIFDADFLPDKEFLKKCIPYFSDPLVGMVQTRWGHINDDYSLLTKAISIGIDGHFQIEQATRCGSGLFLNFNGTAGIWRRKCIEDSGGWQDDTLTEDLDLSYRAQLLGWQLIFLNDVVSPAEVPVQINAFKRQQFRWAKGSIQCAKKLLPGILKSDRKKISLHKKLQSIIHLTYYSVHPMMVALLILSVPMMFAGPILNYFKILIIGTFGPITMYAFSQKELYKDWKSRLKYLPLLTIIGTGISINNSKAVIEALFNKKGTFQRTPKFGIEKNTDRWNSKKYRLGLSLDILLEIFFGLYAMVALYFSVKTGNYFLVPFLMLYVLGYFFTSGLTILHSNKRK